MAAPTHSTTVRTAGGDKLVLTTLPDGCLVVTWASQLNVPLFVLPASQVQALIYLLTSLPTRDA